MKKIVLWILTLFVLLSIVSCGPKTIEEAYENARYKVETLNFVNWEVESEEFLRTGNAYDGWVYTYEINYYAKISFPSETIEKGQAYSTAGTCYRSILKEFGNFDVELNLNFYTKSGSFICTCRVVNGELIY